MKSIPILCALLWTSTAFADDDDAKPTRHVTEDHTGGAKPDEDKPEAAEPGKFSLLSRECKPEESRLETTPGAPPLDVDDPETPGCNAWEINVTTSAEYSRATNYVTPLFDINYGIGDNIQLKFEIPYEVSKAAGVYDSGWGAAEAGIKWRFYESEAAGLAASIYPQIEFAIPGTAAADEGGTITKLPLLVSKKIGETGKGDIMVTGNVGYNISTHDGTESYLSAALGLGLPLVKSVAVFGEVSTEQALGNNMEDVREGYFKANLGVMSPVNDHLLLLAAVGRTFDSTMMDDPNHTCVLVGLRLLAGGP